MLLADENIPAGTISQLRQRGFDVVSVREVCPGVSDDDVLQLAVQQQRVLISFDRDYGELIFKQGKPAPPAVIYFRIRPNSPEEVTELLAWLLGDGAGSIHDKMVIIRRQGVRERPLR